VTPELNALCIAAAKAVGAASWRSTSLRRIAGLLVNEINYTMEFRNSIDTTGVNIPPG
jgi:[lysine-biosynthesis-protein LysW]---L-2-aminoadipate ligase